MMKGLKTELDVMFDGRIMVGKWMLHLAVHPELPLALAFTDTECST